MELRTLGTSDLRITTVGLGTWAIGGGDYAYGWGSQEDDESIQTIHAAIDAGINWIDTAPVYGLGRSEEVVGKAIKGKRQSLIISTKCGKVWNDQTREVGENLDADSVIGECEASLRRLGTNEIDLYHIHWPIPDASIEEGWEAIARLIKEGKVRYGAVSNFSPGQMRRIQPIHPVTSLQPPYSMLVRNIEDEIIPFCEKEKIGITVYSPMQAGLLTGKLTRERIENLPEDDWRKHHPLMQEPQLSANLEVAKRLTELAAEYGKTAGELAIAWSLRNEAVTSAIVGARRPDQILANVGASGWKLSDELLSEIDAVLKKREAAVS